MSTNMSSGWQLLMTTISCSNTLMTIMLRVEPKQNNEETININHNCCSGLKSEAVPTNHFIFKLYNGVMPDHQGCGGKCCKSGLLCRIFRHVGL